MNEIKQDLAVAYLRVSTKEQEDEGYSLENQELSATEYAEKQNLKIVKTWKCSESGWIKKERKYFEEMISYVLNKRNNIKHIIFYSSDRASRNMSDYIKIEQLREQGFTIHYSKIGKKQEGKLSSGDKMYGRVLGTFDEFFSDFISEKTAPAMIIKAKTGVYPSNAPLGYLNNKVDKTIEVDTERAPFIKELFQKVASRKYSIRALANELYEQGLKSKKTGAKVGKSTLYRTINNPFYYGEFYWKGVLYKGTHEPLISKELWDKANEVLKSDKPYITGQKFAFNGIVRCGVCGCTVSGGRYKKNQYLYYHCTQSKEPHKSPFISEEEMIEKLGKIVSDVIIPTDIAEWLKKGIKIYAIKRDKSNKSITELLLKEQKKIRTTLENMYNMEIENDLSETKKEFYRKKEAEYENKLKEIDTKLDKIGKNAEQIEQEVEVSIRLMENLSKWYKKGNPFEKGEIVKALVNEVILTKDNDFVPHYKTPFDIFASTKKNLEGNKDIKNIPNVEEVVENLSKKEKNTRKSGVSSNGLDFEKWGG